MLRMHESLSFFYTWGNPDRHPLPPVMGITIGPVAMRLSRKKRNSLDDTKNFISQESKTLGYHLQCSSIGSQFRLTWSSIFGVYILTKDNGNDGGDIVFGNSLSG